MEGVTDSPYRRLCKEMGADIVFSELTSADGILKKNDHYGKKLNFLPEERPIAIQLFGNAPNIIAEAIKYVELLNPDFIDLNCGCPAKKIISKGAGAALIKDIPLMVAIAKAAVNATDIPVTVKTRIGWDKNSITITDIALRLQDAGISALTIHGRTKSQMFQGEANWEEIAKVKQHRDIKIPIIGNGSINSAEKGINYINKYDVDGIMIGRATLGNPFIFRDIKNLIQNKPVNKPSLKEHIDVCKKHLLLAAQWNGKNRTVFETRKHYSNYFKYLENFKPFRIKLMTALTLEEVFEVMDEICEYYSGN